MVTQRLCFVGDELVAGYGDDRALGWTGRVIAHTLPHLDVYADCLSIPGETTRSLCERWHAEVVRRTDPQTVNRLVIGVGVADVVQRVSLSRSRLGIANMLDLAASEGRPCLVVGPPPFPSVDIEATADLSLAVRDVCARREVPYIDTFPELRRHEQWLSDVQAAGGYHPRQAGYGLLAWIVLHRGWFDWLGVDPNAPRAE